VSGTTEEIRQVVVECLRAIYPLGRAGNGMSVTCFKGRTGADGQPLMWMDEGDKLDKALNELVVEGTIIPHKDAVYGKVFYYKTDTQPPVVGRLEEIKFAIVEYLWKVRPHELTYADIEQGCFGNEYSCPVGANGIRLSADMDREENQKLLDDLVEKGKIDAHEKERDGQPMMHYAAKP